MINKRETNPASGFSLMELLIAMTIILVVLGATATLFSRSLGTRQRESDRTDALTAAQAALNVMSREVANSGYGLLGNGLVGADSGVQQLHFRSNVINTNEVFTDPAEDLTYFFEPVSRSILRHDANGNGPGRPITSIITNRISNLQFQYFDYTGASAIPTQTAGPTVNTGRVRITVQVILDNVQGQVNQQNVNGVMIQQNVTLVSDVTLRNADYMLRQY